MLGMKIKLPNLPTAQALADAIRERRGELVELHELLRLAQIRELRRDASLSPQRRLKRKRGDRQL